MNLSKQIKQLRNRDGLSQEALAEKMYVSRQSISNWENERSYPDIHNLLMLSAIFDVSLDQLVKGDVEMMKVTLQQSNMMKLSWVMLAGLIAIPLSIAPVMKYFGMAGLFIPFVLLIITMIAAVKVEKLKKIHQLKTYRQIMDFYEGKPIRETQPTRKDFWSKVIVVTLSAISSGIIVYIGLTILNV
ncbi:MAG TPA: helix-turn-helix domain-containing protein [Sporosarcina sp.]|nr:helix-turn-helix domain-containing protein [Sporosarcina sp.]